MLTQVQKEALSIALNEATLLGAEVDPTSCQAAITFSALMLPEGEGAPPEDPRVQFLLSGVGRVAASLRPGAWYDQQAMPIAFEIADLLSTVRSFDGLPVYGEEFFDVAEAELEQWGDRLSLDWKGGCGGTTHSLLLFQEGYQRHLDLLLWFELLQIRDARGCAIGLEEFADAGRRWWNGFHNGDPRTRGQGIIPL